MHRLLDRAALRQETLQPFVDLMIGFLLNLNATVVTNFVDPAVRQRYLAATSVLLLYVSGDLYHIFSHIHRVRHAVHRQELSLARAQFLRHYCHKHSFTQTDLYASTALTTDDTNALLNRMSQSEYSDVLVSYFDTTSRHTTASTTTTSTSTSTALVSWNQCVFWDDLLNYQPDNRSNEKDKDIDSAIDADSLPPWNLVGIALFAQYLLQMTEHTEECALPKVYHRAQLITLLQPYALLLLRESKLANSEGLQLVSLVMSPASPAHTGNLTFPSLFLYSYWTHL